jgi:two-component system, OmpR family, phosphate regulon sensor histidine kinase PhoR
MFPEPLFPRNFWAVLAILTAPAAAVLASLALAAFIPWTVAVVAMLAISAVLALLIRTHLRRLGLIAHYLQRLAADGDDPGNVPPRLPDAALEATRELSQAVANSGRAWARRRRDLEAVVAANEAVISGLPDPLIMLDEQRRIVRANPAAEVLLGQNIRGRELFEVLRNPTVTEAVAAAFTSRESRMVEFTLPVPVERSFSAQVEPLARPIVDGTVALLMLQDLTRIKRADRMRADFVANVSHELRTPLSTLIGFIETLRGPAREDRAAQERFLQIMQDQALRMARIVADLLSLSRIELNEHTPPTGELELAPIIHGVADTLEMKASGKQMAIRLDAPPPADSGAAPRRIADLPPVVGDGDELTQVFQNLIDNAIKYGRPGTSVRVAGWIAERGTGGVGNSQMPPRMQGDAAIAIAVMDEGEGIAREHLSRLTERFYRIDTARSRDLGGTGLGLAIVKHILNRHRGLLEIDSAPGRGSCFTVFLPMPREAAE